MQKKKYKLCFIHLLHYEVLRKIHQGFIVNITFGYIL